MAFFDETINDYPATGALGNRAVCARQHHRPSASVGSSEVRAGGRCPPSRDAAKLHFGERKRPPSYPRCVITSQCQVRTAAPRCCTMYYTDGWVKGHASDPVQHRHGRLLARFGGPSSDMASKPAYFCPRQKPDCLLHDNQSLSISLFRQLRLCAVQFLDHSRKIVLVQCPFLSTQAKDVVRITPAPVWRRIPAAPNPFHVSKKLK